VIFFLGIDVGSTLLYEEASGHYIFPLDNNHFTSANLIGLYNEWLSKYPLYLFRRSSIRR
jgi:enolase